MASKDDLKDWLVQALLDLGGSASIVDVCREIWRQHESDLREAGDLFYTWQYDVRWAAQKLRDQGVLKPTTPKSKTPWSLA